ncbi:MAG TPA: VOC family protein [Vicinamibacterales bacterium]|nr:VOC family protein [Vicinamibacterales bacterium]
MIAGARYVHTNLIARDWRKLATFYETVFGCVPVPPQRDYSGPVFDAGTGIQGARLTGMHLRMPTTSENGTTLEIFHYSPLEDGPAPKVNRPGFAHIAFAVDSVEEARAEFLTAGGSPVGEIVTLTTSNGSRVTWCYVADPEGNIVELQHWVKA